MATRRGDARAFGRWSRNLTEKVVPKQVLQLHQKVHLQLVDSLIFDTPVGNPSLWKSPPPEGYVGGRARGGWETTLGAIPDAETGRIDPNGGATQAANHAGLMGLMPFGLSVIVNMVPYIRRLNEGWSTQQAANFVERGLQRVQSQFGGA